MPDRLTDYANLNLERSQLLRKYFKVNLEDMPSFLENFIAASPQVQLILLDNHSGKYHHPPHHIFLRSKQRWISSNGFDSAVHTFDEHTAIFDWASTLVELVLNTWPGDTYARGFFCLVDSQRELVFKFECSLDADDLLPYFWVSIFSEVPQTY